MCPVTHSASPGILKREPPPLDRLKKGDRGEESTSPEREGENNTSSRKLAAGKTEAGESKLYQRLGLF